MFTKHLRTHFTALMPVAVLLWSGAPLARSQQGLIPHKALSLDMAMTMTQGSAVLPMGRALVSGALSVWGISPSCLGLHR